jgi:hypothetical protein
MVPSPSTEPETTLGISVGAAIWMAVSLLLQSAGELTIRNNPVDFIVHP